MLKEGDTVTDPFNALNVKGRKKEGKKDSLSAVLILQGYMAVHS